MRAILERQKGLMLEKETDFGSKVLIFLWVKTKPLIITLILKEFNCHCKTEGREQNQSKTQTGWEEQSLFLGITMIRVLQQLMQTTKILLMILDKWGLIKKQKKTYERLILGSGTILKTITRLIEFIIRESQLIWQSKKDKLN